jgi:Asp-tRNA(Asn)/Glu-tRNA(Gln) amidotransferase B subunit
MTLPLWIVTPKQNAEIVKMISEGLISRKTASDVLEWVIEQNMALLAAALKDKP